ncbi:heme peroxidase [Rhizoctonia solani]|uniref:Heme peroxidase n=1 Tax=Rhizoctonia solani TaxID=456999 RepID=A0A8H7LFJ1_9AGAM|nr:heme peroxidase [Rhizoctonia solani]
MAYLAPLEDAKTLKETMMKMVGGDTALDDRAGTMNKIFAVIPKLPQDSELSKTMNDYLITMLYNSLPHPPTSYVGEDRFRKADGSRNNVIMPDLGRAGTTYARNVQGRRLQPPTYLPPTSMVYDELLKATGSRDSHPGGNSSMTFAFASLVTHSLFRTDPSDWGKNNTSSYLDLSPLYGSNEAEQDLVRVKDGRGLLHPDTFSEGRLVFLPPASGALLVIWNRNHNYIANNILKINEQKRWSDPPPEDPAKRAQQDKEIFETARLINCGSFMSVIFGDYVAGFLGLGREGSSWSMQPFDPIKGSEGEVGRGEGNHCSVEFNVLYRWHAVTSEADEKWTSDIFDKIFSKKSSELELSDFYEALGRLRNGDVDESLRVDADPRKRNFGGIKRGPDGRFSDGDLAKILHNSTESVARRYGARGSPEVLRIIEIMGMEQARKWGVCTMNEFRKYLGLKTFKSFEEWNSDPAIANAARKLYKNIDDLELYPGLHAEECMKLGPGSGLCAGYTITRGILSDAIALVRGDRFFTTDFTPERLTSWGFEDVKRDPNNGAFGAYLPKLLLRTLPRHYTYNSAYGLFPFFTPETTKQNLTKLKVADQYDFKRPSEAPIPKPLNNFTAIKHVSNDIVKYKVPYGPDMKYLTYDRGMFLIFDEQPLHDNDRQLAFHALFPSNDVVKSHVDYYSKKIKELIACRSSKYDNIPGTFVDIIDVINKAAVHWASENLCGIIPKYEKNPNGEISDEALYQKFAILFSCVFRNTEPYLGWALRRGAKAASDEINGKIKANLERIQTPPIAGPIFLGIKSALETATGQTRPSDNFHKALLSSKKPVNDLTAMVLGLCVGSSVNFAQATAQMVEFYMDDAHKKEREHIFQLASKNDDESTQLLAGYYREAARLNPQFPALVRIAVAQDEIPQSGGKPPISVKPGDRLFCSYRNAHLDPELFPNPEKVDPRRPKENYAVQATGTHGCPGMDFSEQSIPAIMRAVFGLKNLRPAPGVLGTLESFDSSLLGTKIRTYIDEKGCPSPWPTSLVLVYDS